MNTQYSINHMLTLETNLFKLVDNYWEFTGETPIVFCFDSFIEYRGHITRFEWNIWRVNSTKPLGLTVDNYWECSCLNPVFLQLMPRNYIVLNQGDRLIITINHNDRIDILDSKFNFYFEKEENAKDLLMSIQAIQSQLDTYQKRGN